MDDVLDDIGAEVEINPDEVEVVSKKKPRKTRLLKREEKKALLDMLSGVASNPLEVVSVVMVMVAKEDHIHVFKEREKLCIALQSSQ